MNDTPLLEIRSWANHAAQLLAGYTPDLERQLPCPVTDLTSSQNCDRQLRDSGLLGVWYQGKLAGGIGLTPPNTHRNGWCWYWIFQDFRGRSIASSALCALANAALSTRWHRLELGYRTNNPASAKVAENAGFIIEGYEREKFIWGNHRVDAVLAARLSTDPRPEPQLSVDLSQIQSLN